MKKVLSIILLFTSVLVFEGCPYESPVPIDSPSLFISSKMFGTWKARKNPDEIFKVSKFDDHTYSIEKINTKSNEKAEKYFAFGSVVNGVTFLNFTENNPNNSSPKYYLYKMELSNEGTLILSEVTDNIDEKFTTSDDLKKFIASNMKNSYFFTKDETTYVRVGK